jgi:hypothetical protein
LVHQSFCLCAQDLTGEARIDLDGKMVGTVTFPEQEDERRRMQARKKLIQDKREMAQRDHELSRRQAEMAAAAALKPIGPAPPQPNEATTMNVNNRLILIELARSMAPIRVSELIAAARDKGATATDSTLSAYTYKLIHDGKISKDWIKLGPNFGAPFVKSKGKPTNGAVVTAPAELTPSPRSISTEHLRARIALFESALSGSANKQIAKQMAADVAKMVVDEMSALVKAL